MRADMNKLRGKIAEKRITQDELALKVGMNPSTFYRKMKADGLAFTIGQMHQIVEVLDISPEEAKLIFLNQNSQ